MYKLLVGLVFQFTELQDLIFIIFKVFGSCPLDHLYTFYILYNLLEKQRFLTEHKAAVVCSVMSASLRNLQRGFVSQPAVNVGGSIRGSLTKNDKVGWRW